MNLRSANAGSMMMQQQQMPAMSMPAMSMPARRGMAMESEMMMDAMP